MATSPFSIRLEAPGDDPSIEALNEDVFGPGRFARAAYRIREGIPHEPGLSFVGEVDGRLIASVRLTRITIGEREALLLGPLVVDPPWKGKGCGKELVRVATAAAGDQRHDLVILVGDPPYYGPLGFGPIEPPGAVSLPGPVDPARLLVAELKVGAAEGLAGRVLPAGRQADG